MFRRAETMIAGKRAFFLRIPGEGDNEFLFRFTADDVGNDWFQNRERHEVKYPEFKQVREADYERAFQLMRTSFEDNAATGASNAPHIHLPPSAPTQADTMSVAADPDGQYRIPFPRTGSGSDTRSRFRFPAPNTSAASSSSSSPLAPAKEELTEPLDDAQLARVMQSLEEMQSEGPFTIEDSPPVLKRMKREPQ